MKDILKHYSKYILLDTLVAATLFAGAHGILSLFHLKFIEWFYYAVKYRLQGTTQGRYLTGGVPPVRFSM